jgi:hypothetical protein
MRWPPSPGLAAEARGRPLPAGRAALRPQAAGQPEFPLYGVCCYTMDLQQRAPCVAGRKQGEAGASGGGAAGAAQQLPLDEIRVSYGGGEFLVRAQRCYCLLSHYPFFELHYHVRGGAGGCGRLPLPLPPLLLPPPLPPPPPLRCCCRCAAPGPE